MFLHRIRNRLVVMSVSLVVLSLLFSGRLVYWSLRSSLENELGGKLEAVARAASVLYSAEELTLLGQTPGPRARSGLLGNLEKLRQVTEVERIYLFSDYTHPILDTDTAGIWPDASFQLQFYRSEVGRIYQGESSHSPLYHDAAGNPRMLGFAPLSFSGEIAGGVAVDGSAAFLAGLDALKSKLLLTGLVAVVLAMIIAVITGGTISRPIMKLAALSRRIAKGDYSLPITVGGGGEPHQLAETMETMRSAVLERERELKAMLSGIAHEIRTPLSGIELFCGLLRDSIPVENDKALDQLERIVREVRQLGGIVNHFLEFARPREPNRQPCSLSATIEECRQLLTDRLQSATVTVRVPGNREDAKIMVDPDHLKRILLNLMQNSIQAMPQGGTISLSWETENSDCRLFIEDSGPGIPREVRDTVFQPFYTTREKGIGLGLSIVKNLVKSNKGEVKIVRSDPKGTRFCVRFPLAG